VIAWARGGIASTKRLIHKENAMNQDNHDLLIAHGYEHTFHTCTFEDIGDPENGPELTGDPEYHEYASSTEYLYGKVAGQIECRYERYAWLEIQEAKMFANYEDGVREVVVQDREHAHF
jgi:hypothetical protein